MTRICLLGTAERHAVEDKYIGNVAFAAFRGPCFSLFNTRKTLALHPSELFYLCIYYIDQIKPLGILEAQQYCRTTVSGDLLYYLQEKTGKDDVPDFNLVKGQILLSVALFLEWSGDGKYVPLINILTREASYGVDAETFRLLGIFHSDCSKYHDMKALKEYAGNYVRTTEFLFDEIAEMLEELPTDDEQDSGEQVTRFVHLANGRKTALVILLKRMYEKGWLVDAEGNGLTNRDKAIREIMKNAFGEENVSPSQLLSALTSRGYHKDENDYIKELFE